jgi:hypothetical protein
MEKVTMSLNTPAVVAEKTGLHYNTILTHIAKGNIQVTRIGGMNLITDEEIERFKSWHSVHGGRWGK